MPIRDCKINAWGNPVANEADRPNRSAGDMKAIFDANSNQLKAALSDLIDAILDFGSSAELGSAKVSEDVPAGTVWSQLRALRGIIHEQVGTHGQGIAILGTYDTRADLEASVPAPNVGNAYGVGAGPPYDVHIYTSNGWKNFGPLYAGQSSAIPYSVTLEKDEWTEIGGKYLQTVTIETASGSDASILIVGPEVASLAGSED